MADNRKMPSAARFTKPPAPQEFVVPKGMLNAPFWVALSLLRSAHYNPAERRDSVSNQDVQKLAASQLKTGTHGMVWVTKPDRDGYRTIIDGHRTAAALLVNGHTHALCLEYAGDPNTLFAAINGNQKPLSSNQKLRIYLKSPMAVDDYVRPALRRMLDEVGRPIMTLVGKKGGSKATFEQAELMAEYCKRPENKEFVKKALLWLVKHRATKVARQFMDGGGCSTRLANAVFWDEKLIS